MNGSEISGDSCSETETTERSDFGFSTEASEAETANASASLSIRHHSTGLGRCGCATPHQLGYYNAGNQPSTCNLDRTLASNGAKDWHSGKMIPITRAAPDEGRDEAAMIVSILAGKMSVYHDLIRPYEKRVFLMALSLMKNEADAEDVAQEAFLKAYRKLASFRAEANFSTWLLSITLNEARSRLRQRKGVRVESLDVPVDEGGVSPALLRDWREIPSEAVERKEVRELLQRAVGKLPDTYREVFLLRDVEGLDGAEAAQALGITVANVKVRLHRARTMLQKELAPQLKSVQPQKRRWLPWS